MRETIGVVLASIVLAAVVWAIFNKKTIRAYLTRILDNSEKEWVCGRNNIGNNNIGCNSFCCIGNGASEDTEMVRST